MSDIIDFNSKKRNIESIEQVDRLNGFVDQLTQVVIDGILNKGLTKEEAILCLANRVGELTRVLVKDFDEGARDGVRRKMEILVSDTMKKAFNK